MSQTALEYLFEKLWETNKDKFEWTSILKQAKQKNKEQMIGFHKWMKENDTPEKAAEYFGYSDEDMLNEYLNHER